MFRSLVFTVLFSVVAAAVQDSDVEITIDITPSKAHPGENMTAICRVINMPEGEDIFWYKAVVTNTPEGDEYVDIIANSLTGALPPFDRNPNYFFDSYVSGHTNIFVFHVSNVSVEEGGQIGCSYREIDDQVVAVQHFEVYDPVDAIIVYQNDTEVETLTAEAGEDMEINILIGRSVPAAKALVTLGGEDVTDQMVSTHTMDAECAGDKAQHPCPVHYLIFTRAQGHAELLAKHYKHELVVSAYVPGSGFPFFNRTFPVEMDYAPIFMCGTLQTAFLGESYEVACSSRSWPKPSMSVWTFEEQGTQRKIPAPFEDSQYKARFVEKNDGEYLATLEIKAVDMEHFKNYTLNVANSIGNQNRTLSLHEGPYPTESGAAAASLSLLLMLLVLLI